MARMIPARVYEGTKSKGELEVFANLRDDRSTTGWIVLHSLDIAQHTKRLAGEVDFVVIVPDRGVLCLEVKAALRIRREEGLWYYGANSEPDPRGPFRQASEAMHSLREQVSKKCQALAKVMFWSAVIFPYFDFNVSSNEWHSWQLINGTTFRQQPLSKSILSIFHHAREHVLRHTSKWFRSEDKGPTISECEQIANLLRPNFEFFVPPKVELANLNAEIKKFTEEQFVAIDAMETNDRVVFTGPAGTGKTLLAVEAARRSSTQGRKTLLLCFNRQLGRKLEEDTTSLQPNVTVSNLHKYMLAVSGERAPEKQVNGHYWEDELPNKAMEMLIQDETGKFLFDELIVDEAQDVLRENYLDFLELSLRGGLKAGRWRLFGDFERQAIYDGHSSISLQDAMNLRFGASTIFNLRVNCRNTPRISALVHLLGDLSPGYSRVLRPDDGIEPRFKYYRDAEHQSELLAETLEELIRAGYSYSDVVVLSTRANPNAIANKLPEKWRSRLRPFEDAGSKHIRYCSIHSFKGLESLAIVVTDIDQIMGEKASSLFYVATTRSLRHLSILTSASVRSDIVSLLLN